MSVRPASSRRSSKPRVVRNCPSVIMRVERPRAVAWRTSSTMFGCRLGSPPVMSKPRKPLSAMASIWAINDGVSFQSARRMPANFFTSAVPPGR